MHSSKVFRQSFLTLFMASFATAAFAQTPPAKPTEQAKPAEPVRAPRRPARQGRRLGADAAGARRQDARHGEGHAERLPHGSRVGRRPHRHHRCQARRDGDGRRVQPRHGGAVEGGTPQESGVADRATFVQADLFKTDLSRRRSSRCSCCRASTCSCGRPF